MKLPYIENKYYRIYTNKRGMRVLQTNKKMLADAIRFTTEAYVHKFNNPDGSITYSFEWNPRLQEIAEELVRLHEESLKLKNEQKFDE